MSNWLHNKHNDDEVIEVRPEIDAMLPPSVRQPEKARLAYMGDAADDPDDADLDFLAALASEVDRKAAAPGAAPAATPLRGASPRIDDLHVFREMKDEGAKVVRFDHRVADVEMGDLLEELSTVRAALRGRRAA